MSAKDKNYPKGTIIIKKDSTIKNVSIVVSGSVK